MKEKERSDFMTLVMINFFDDGFHVINEATLPNSTVVQIYVCVCTATDVLIFDLMHVGFVKLLLLKILYVSQS